MFLEDWFKGKIPSNKNASCWWILVMSFGLTNFPATFQCAINTILRPFLKRHVQVFYMTIFSYRRYWKEHMQHLWQVFEATRISGLEKKKHLWEYWDVLCRARFLNKSDTVCCDLSCFPMQQVLSSEFSLTTATIAYCLWWFKCLILLFYRMPVSLFCSSIYLFMVINFKWK